MLSCGKLSCDEMGRRPVTRWAASCDEVGRRPVVARVVWPILVDPFLLGWWFGPLLTGSFGPLSGMVSPLSGMVGPLLGVIKSDVHRRLVKCGSQIVFPFPLPLRM